MEAGYAKSFDSGNKERDQLVLSSDFLEADKYPEVTFTGRSDKDTLIGELTIRGVTQRVRFEIEEFGTTVGPFGNTRVGIEAATTIYRSHFGLTWNSPLETD